MLISRRSCLIGGSTALAAYRNGGTPRARAATSATGGHIVLPTPKMDSDLSLEEAIVRRRSVRAYDHTPLSLEQLSQLLWAAQGVSHPRGFRTAPSAGALYPLEIYVLAGDVTGLGQGVYKYRAGAHELVLTHQGDLRAATARAALGQSWAADGRAILVLAAVFRRTTAKYGARGERYVHMEVGHAAQNVYLQATALGLGTTVVGAFRDEEIHDLLGMSEEEAPLALLPVGRLPA